MWKEKWHEKVCRWSRRLCSYGHKIERVPAPAVSAVISLLLFCLPFSALLMHFSLDKSKVAWIRLLCFQE